MGKIETRAHTDGRVTERELRNKELAYLSAVESIVLLKNDGTLPLTPGKIALFGTGADYTVVGGTGSGEVNVRHSISITEGLEAAGFSITTKDWIERYDRLWKSGKESFIRENRKKLRRISTKVLAELMAAEYRYPDGEPITPAEILESGTDTCIYVLSRQSGEGKDRRDEAGSYRLSETEIGNIRICAESYRRFVLVLNTGAPIDLSALDEFAGINAIVCMGQLGMESGRALADILTGKQTPSGKLAVTWAKRYADYPFSDEFGPYAANKDHALYKEGIFVGYRHFDRFQIEPRYAFGFGRSYTTFSLSIRSAEMVEQEIRISVEVKNAGLKYSGKETVQLYVSCPQEGQVKEVQRLAAFAKTGLLAPGGSECLILSVPLDALTSYDEARAETYLEKGRYLLLLGADSRTTNPVAVMLLERRVCLRKHRNLCASDKKIYEGDSQTPNISEAEALEGLPILKPDLNLIQTVTYAYDEIEETFSTDVRRHMESLSATDKIRFCAGTGLFGEKKGFQTPGAVGHTTTDYLKEEIPNVELCDGPAGLRLQRRSARDRKGNIKPVDAAISLYEFLPDFLRKHLLGDPNKDTLLYQYVTGFPVAASLAQTWNTDLLYRIGQAVAEEMEEFGVTYWLAPALNIVRNPLCGRNFEYYSEDPLISGKMAAAVTKGVQERPGKYVTVKHFAANNQEENLYHVSSDVDERALREIYLRGFEIVIREAAPRAVMAAYNKLNGLYCTNNRELCTDILRSEWGFRGLVMTDWLSTGESRADEAECLNAGVDLIMPGGKDTLKALRKAYKAGRLSSQNLGTSCSRVLENTLNSQREGSKYE